MPSGIRRKGIVMVNALVDYQHSQADLVAGALLPSGIDDLLQSQDRQASSSSQEA